MELRKKWEYWCILFSFMAVYYIPSSYLTSLGIPIDSIIVGGWMLISFVILIKIRTKFSLKEFLYIVSIFALCLFKLSVSPLILLTPIIMNHFLKKSEKNIFNRIVYETYIPYIAVFFTIIYSLFYGMRDGRFLHVGIEEVNESGLAVFLLALIIKKRTPKFGNIVLLAGLLSLSRNYILAIVIYGLWNINYVKKICKKIYNKNLLNLNLILPITVVVLYFLGIYCEDKYSQGGIFFELSLKDRIKNIFDMSNYFRFTVVVFLINIFLINKKYLIIGCNENIFREECYRYANIHGQLYVGNNPHNLFLSYLKLYGIIGCFYIYYVSNCIRKCINQNNLFIYIILLMYAIFLGASFNGYWLIIAIFAFELYKE